MLKSELKGLDMQTCEEWWEEEGWGSNKDFFACAKDGWDAAIRATGIETGTSDSQHGRKPDKVKPLAQYLAIISDMGMPKTEAFFEQALDAYESIENVKIRIERV